MRKKCIINARFLTQPITGVQRYAIELLKSLDNLIDRGEIDAKQCSFMLLAPQEIKYELNLKNIPVKTVGKLQGHLWEQLELPFYARKHLLLNLCNTGSLLKSNQIVTIHDAAVFAVPQTYSLIFRTWYKLLLTGLGKISKKIITDSSFSKKELMYFCKMGAIKLKVILLGSEHILSIPIAEDILQKNGIGNKPFLLAVSSMNPNKNFHSIVRAIELLGDVGFDIVIAGGTNPKIFSQSELFFSERVRHLGYVSDEELRTLYEHAACFIYPSFYEGFGLPPLEAMACGCPVIVSNAASLPEVCGEAALYCDPHDPTDIADKIRQLMDDADLREMLQEKGLERAKQFTWDKCARETFAVIEEVLAR